MYTICAFGISCFFSCKVQAQLCNGSLGDPIVNITFGESRNDSAANFAPGTSYIYTPFDCPLDGSYTITNTNISCFDTAWHVITDHTGNGNFMLVNASFPPGDFFVTTVTNLCPNTTYEFAAWIINLLINNDGSNPNITFSIETTDSIVLKQFNTNDINSTPEPEWKQYGFFFTTPSNNANIVLRMTNNARGIWK